MNNFANIGALTFPNLSMAGAGDLVDDNTLSTNGECSQQFKFAPALLI